MIKATFTTSSPAAGATKTVSIELDSEGYEQIKPGLERAARVAADELLKAYSLPQPKKSRRKKT